ncbi:MAG: hypothetical protein PUG96_02045 [Prevotellaceae bacterium]|nr:hypothetical protein [Prevotella sp.]MDD7272734.1 hypothetical protein [Prevotellaceae bacterium]
MRGRLAEIKADIHILSICIEAYLKSVFFLGIISLRKKAENMELNKKITTFALLKQGTGRWLLSSFSMINKLLFLCTNQF